MNISELLCRRFGFSQIQLKAYVQTCPHRYKTYPIDKRTKGVRWISQPSRDLKAVQRFLLDQLLNPKLAVHDAATAYRSKLSIIDNVRPHLKNPYLLKMDFSDFFPSIRGHDFVQYLLEEAIVGSEEDASTLAQIFFKRDLGDLKLTIGSPGSPIISNALLYKFDDFTDNECKKRGINYTRYSDDMAFSTNHKGALFEIPALIEEALRNVKCPKLKINRDKTIYTSKKFNRHITGITITNEGTQSIGRDRKRLLRAQIFDAPNLSKKELGTSINR
jgi:retron-type reverse transcriptase